MLRKKKKDAFEFLRQIADVCKKNKGMNIEGKFAILNRVKRIAKDLDDNVRSDIKIEKKDEKITVQRNKIFKR